MCGRLYSVKHLGYMHPYSAIIHFISHRQETLVD